MTSLGEALSIDPVDLVAPDSRLFIDTNVFMDTDPRRRGGLKNLFERVAPAIQQGGAPVIIPTKVTDELLKQSQLDPAALDFDRAEAVKKAANALKFIAAAEATGLVRNDLGDETNPYADDLFVRLFQAYAGRYGMFLITNDITLLIRVNLLGRTTGREVAAGRLYRDGTIEYEAPQSLYTRGLTKLRKLKSRVERSDGEAKDHLEVRSLESSLDEYQRAFGTSAPPPTALPNQSLGATRQQATQPRQVTGAFSEAPGFRGPDQVLSGTEIPGEGDHVVVESPAGSTTLQLGCKLGEGGEGSVYEISDGQVVKIFDQEHLTRHREEKIELLVSRGFDHEGICFPQAVVRNPDGDFVGYLMPKANGREFSRTIFSPPRFKREFPTWTKADLVDVAISFLEKVSYLHSLNIILGDINPKNVLVGAAKEVWIIDADSWQLEGYPCPVGTDRFTPPALLGTSYSTTLRTMEDERFAVATMLFMILITGLFPYQRKGFDSGDIGTLIKDGNFAFQFEENSNQDQPGGNWKYMWSHIQKPLKGLFWHTFHRDGDRYASRPTDDEWLQAFRRYRHYLGSNQNFDPMSNDVYPTRFKAMDPDTPIYECAGCGASMAGIWNDKAKEYTTPKFCHECRSNLPKCADCGKHKSSLKDGVCWDCNRKRNFSTCLGCGRQKPTTSLIDGRCYDCNQGTCASCGRGVRRQYLINGICDRCQAVACKDCGTLTKKSDLSYGRCQACRAKDTTLDPSRACDRCGKPFITFGNIAWHIRQGKTIPTTHQYNDSNCVPEPAHYSRSRSATSHSPTPVITSARCKDCGSHVPRSELSYGRCKACQAKQDTLDPMRKCARCGQPFITHGNVDWHRRMGKSVPTTHKDYSECAVAKTTSKATAKSSGGCFIATAVYGSYDCPEVWVLRRWRDSALVTSSGGAAFVRAYYATSPHLVALLGDKSWFTRPVKRLLDWLVEALKRSGFTDLPYRDNSRN